MNSFSPFAAVFRFVTKSRYFPVLRCLAWLLVSSFGLKVAGETTATIELNPVVRFELTEGSHYNIEQSVDMEFWEPIEENVLGTGEWFSFQLSEEEVTGKFFRARRLQNQWVEVWADSFEGDKLDRSKWAVDVNAHGGGNNELQYYTDEPENVFVEGGNLVIQAMDTPYGGLDGSANFTSGKVHTKFRGDWKYGKIEARARLPIGQGIWPAIWMLPLDNEYGGWAASGEIDIMELVGHEPSTVHGTIHYGGAWPLNMFTGASYELEEGTFEDEFHVFSLEWEEGELRWYVDGELYQTLTSWNSTNGDFPAPFDQPFYLIMNVAVGGNWPGSPDSSTQFPARMEVDYVRVYQWVE